MTRRDRIAHSFNRASATYNSASELQARAAQALAARILGQKFTEPRALELGCGTGGLTHLLLPRLPGDWIISDIAPAMLETVRTRFPAFQARFRILDGQSIDLPQDSLDLIVSNLAAQWFDDLPAALRTMADCLAPQGRLAITTLGEASLSQWRKAVAATGYQVGTPAYPTAAAVAQYLPQLQVTSQIITMTYGSAGDFLQSLKAIGATIPAKGYKPMPTPILRQAMSYLGAPCSIDYEILTLEWGKS